MKKLKLSQWHEANTNPTYIGVYQRDWGDSLVFTKWTGCHWSFSYECNDSDALQNAARCSEKTYAQNLKWRGIVK